MLDLSDEIREEIQNIEWNNSYEGKAIVDKDLVILDANQRLCHLTGYSRFELLGKVLNDLSMSTDSVADLRMFVSLVQGEENDDYYEITKMFIPKGGKAPFLGKVRVDAVYDKARNFKYALCRFILIQNGQQAEVIRDILVQCNQTNNSFFIFIKKYFQDNPLKKIVAILTIVGMVFAGGNVVLDIYYETRHLRDLNRQMLEKIQKSNKVLGQLVE